jgi:hypothetical protein
MKRPGDAVAAHAFVMLRGGESTYEDEQRERRSDHVNVQ